MAYLTPADIARPGDNQGQQTHPAEGEEEEGKRVQWDPELVQHQESQGEAEATPPPTPFSPLVKEKQDLPLQTQEQVTHTLCLSSLTAIYGSSCNSAVNLSQGVKVQTISHWPAVMNKFTTQIYRKLHDNNINNEHDVNL